MATKGLVFDLKEIRHIGVVCPECKTETSFDLSSPYIPFHRCVASGNVVPTEEQKEYLRKCLTIWRILQTFEPPIRVHVAVPD
jgi:hypothetical protein